MIGDEKLIARTRQADKSAFDELVKRHFAMVRRVAQNFASIDEDINDLVQETFITAYDRLHQLNDPDKFTAWLAAIARNECITWRDTTIAKPLIC
jgi:RNA polymerase sigma-70 factor (ECF subfamily)